MSFSRNFLGKSPMKNGDDDNLKTTTRSESGMSDTEYTEAYKSGNIFNPNLEEVDLGTVKSKPKTGGVQPTTALSIATLPTAVRNLGMKALKFGLTSATRPLRKKIAENLRPFGYMANTKSPLERITSVLTGTPEPGSIASDEQEPWHRQYKPKEGMQAKRERQDLLSMMMTGEQRHGSIPVSEYKPTKAKDKNVTYYSSPETERDILNMVQNPDWKGSLDELKEKYGRVLGRYTINKGEDEKGKYISYYDVWDLNPYRGKSKVADIASTAGQYFAGVKPAEIYGRVYY